MAGVASLLLIGCASLANLLIARAVARSGEVVLRAALGAGRGRLIRQSLTELLPLLLLGGLAGVLLARTLLGLSLPLLPVTMPRVEGIALRLPILLFAAGALALTGIITGVWPAFQVARWDVASALRESIRGTSSTLRGSGVRDLLVIAQIAVALLLTVSAALLAKSFTNVARTDAGFRADGVATLHLAIPRVKYPKDAQIADVCGRILARVRRLPGVQAAGLGNRLPLAGGAAVGSLEVEQSAVQNGRVESVDWRTVTPEYFKAMGIPLIEGRLFEESDAQDAQSVGILDERLARRAWPNQSALGRRFRIPIGGAPWVTIVGVVGHVRHDDMSVEGRPQVYWNYRQRAQDRMALVVRSEQDPSAIVGAVIAEIRSVDPEQAVYDVRSMSDVVDRALGQQWLTTAVLSAFAVVSLLMSAVGVYGVVAYGVRQRAREFSVRIALGAAKRDVLILVLRRGALLAGYGVAIGIVASLIATRALRTLLHDVSATDAVSFGIATVILGVGALLATIIPAGRAVSVEPMAVLRGG
jgi:predicted permease